MHVLSEQSIFIDWLKAEDIPFCEKWKGPGPPVDFFVVLRELQLQVHLNPTQLGLSFTDEGELNQ